MLKRIFRVFLFMVKLMAKYGLLAALTGPELDATLSWKLAHLKARKKHVSSGKKWIPFTGSSLLDFKDFFRFFKS
jgi:hypothetical protein